MTLHRLARLTAAMTFLLLIAGGLVTSTHSGLSVPDWPLSYGTLFPPMVGGIRYEHTHRLIAGFVAILITILAIRLWRQEPRRWVRWLGYGALLAVLTQAVLGGLTVLLVLPAPISIAHACLGQTVFCLVVSLALVTSPQWQAPWPAIDDHATPSLRALCWLMSASLAVQLVLGAVIRHGGRAVLLHMMNATLIAGLVALVVWRVLRPFDAGHGLWPWALAQGRPERGKAESLDCARDSARSRLERAESKDDEVGATSFARGDPRYAAIRPLIRPAVFLACGVAVQIALGFSTLLHREQALLSTAHVAVGALLLAGACVMTWSAYRVGGISSASSRAVLSQPSFACPTPAK